MASSGQVLCSSKARAHQHRQVAFLLHYSLVHLYGFPSLPAEVVFLMAHSNLLLIISYQLHTQALLPQISVSVLEVAAFALEVDPLGRLGLLLPALLCSVGATADIPTNSDCCSAGCSCQLWASRRTAKCLPYGLMRWTQDLYRQSLIFLTRRRWETNREGPLSAWMLGMEYDHFSYPVLLCTLSGLINFYWFPHLRVSADDCYSDSRPRVPIQPNQRAAFSPAGDPVIWFEFNK